MIYKSSVDFPSETESIDESCFDFIGDFIGQIMYFEGSRPTSIK